MISSFIDHEDFFHHFQPIYDLKEGYIVGYEVLLRSKKFANPELAFNSAIKEKKLYELDSRSIHKALKTYHSAGFTRKEGILFVNVFPSTLLNPKFPSFITIIMKEKLLTNQDIVFEISEKETNYDLNHLKKVLKQLKKVGISYAIDDYGIS
ncbi:EAL domain-containing protein, partial [Bacillaceae bacterium S4-13-56]